MSTRQDEDKQASHRKTEQLKINLSDYNRLEIEFVNSEGTQLAVLEFDRELSTGKPCITIGRPTSDGITLLQMDFPATEAFPV
jgi:hypothetical protein